MKNKLDVYLNQNLVGALSINAQGDMSFVYDSNYIQDKTNQALSQSLPLQKASYDAKQCRPFFSGILPEARLRVSIARHLGISEQNDFALLAAIGGECAGAVSLLPLDTLQTDLHPDYRIIDDNTVSSILETMIQKPLLAGEDGVRLSLAGAQDKLAIALIDGHIAIPIGGAASTHILKPVNRDFPSLIENECFCLKLARDIGLKAVEASMHKADGKPYLLIKRYDRIETAEGIQRLHQEDFCQAMAIIPEMKYQREGGPGITNCVQLLRQASSVPVLDIKDLIQGILFNLIIGNNDAHGKNFSLLYHKNQTRLAPFYDMISTIQYPNLANKMAMKIGSKYDFESLFPRHIEQMANDAHLSAALVRKETLSILSKIYDTLHTIKANPFSKAILERAGKLMERLRKTN
jgi:serine/threonine-protein kinase HipA